MAKIQDDNCLYSFLRLLVDYHTSRAYRRYKVIGYDNIPKDVACIFGANHTNTLMDAMVLLNINSEKKVFIARGDIFKKPTIAKILNSLKILPIYRIRDGYKSVRDNNSEIIDKAVDVIRDEVKLLLYPEAAHRTKHSLRQLSKGIFHIALQANKEFGHEKPVYIVPIGIEYGDYFRFRSTVLINIGEAINVTEYVSQHKDDNEAVIMNGLRDLLTERISKLISYIPDNEEDYEAIWELTKIKSPLKGSLEQRLESNQKVIKEILDFKEKEPEKAKEVFEKVEKFTKKRRKEGISVTSVSKDNILWTVIWKTLVTLIGLPLYLATAIVTLPIWLATHFIRKGLKDKAFGNTVSYCVELVLHTLLMIICITLTYSLLPWEIATLCSIFFHYSYTFFIDFKEFSRRWISDVKFLFSKKLRKMRDKILK